MDVEPLRRQLLRKSIAVGNRMADEWQRELRATSPVDSGRMRDRTKVAVTRTDNLLSWTATVDTDYAEAQAFGAQPHEIRPRRASALVFYWPRVQRVVFFKRVSHPGNPAHPWWENSLRGLRGMLQRVWDSVP